MGNKIGEIGNSYGIPVLTGWGLSLSPSNASPICRSDRKESVQLITEVGRCNRCIVSRRCDLET